LRVHHGHRAVLCPGHDLRCTGLSLARKPARSPQARGRPQCQNAGGWPAIPALAGGCRGPPGDDSPGACSHDQRGSARSPATGRTGFSWRGRGRRG